MCLIKIDQLITQCVHDGTQPWTNALAPWTRQTVGQWRTQGSLFLKRERKTGLVIVVEVNREK